MARLGGDEFAILLTGATDPDAAEAVAHRIVQAVKRRRTLARRRVTVTGSVGIAKYPRDGADTPTLLRNADLAMYRIKQRGGDGFEAYAPRMGAGARTRLKLENDLRAAVTKERIILHYQPQVSIESGAVVGVEALARWDHPGRAIGPAEFIPIAEQVGLIVPLQRMLMRSAVSQLRQWSTAGLTNLRLAINLSGRCLRESDIVDYVARHVTESGVSPSALEFEITESVALDDIDLATRSLTRLRKLGATVALDDFGMGYSSFSHLRQLPLDAIKLDISLVRDLCVDPGADAIVAAILTMARELGLRVIAEGVETEEQLEALRQRGCDDYQGFLFSKALPAAEVTALLLNGSVKR